ncbi:hypothetical protein [Kribbella rubisoli]
MLRIGVSYATSNRVRIDTCRNTYLLFPSACPASCRPGPRLPGFGGAAA